MPKKTKEQKKAKDMKKIKGQALRKASGGAWIGQGGGMGGLKPFEG